MDKNYHVRCTQEQREKLSLLVSKCKEKHKETVAEILIRALEKLKEGKE